MINALVSPLIIQLTMKNSRRSQQKQILVVQNIFGKLLQSPYKNTKMSKQEIQSTVFQEQFRSLLTKNAKTRQITEAEINRILNLGLNMKLVLMQSDGIKVVQEMLKTVRKMNIITFVYKDHLDSLLNLTRRKIASSSDSKDELFQFSPKKNTQKQISSESLQSNRQKTIQSIVEELYNARQDALKVEQIDQKISFANGPESSTKIQVQGSQLTKFNQKQLQQTRSQLLDLRKALAKHEQQSKVYRKMIEESTKVCLEKDEKIQNLKGTISRLQQVVIKQFKVQGQSQQRLSASDANFSSQKASNNESNLIKSEALQKQVIQLKQQIQILRQNLSQSCGSPVKNEKQKAKQVLQTKQFEKISNQYKKLKQSIFDCTKEDSNEPTSFEIDVKSQNEENEDLSSNLKVEYEILNEKYNSLSKMYNKLKQESQKFASRRNQMMKKQSVFSISSLQLGIKQEKNEVKKQKNSNKSKGRNESKKKVEQKLSKDLQFGSDDEDIIRDIDQINKMEKMKSSEIGINSFQSIINAKEMGNKIEGFQFSNSFIHKVNSTKFIQTFQAKLSLVLQYVCILQLYFNKAFLSCIREQLMMEEKISIKYLSLSDLNPTYFVEPIASQQNSSFNANSSKISSMSSPNKPSQKQKNNFSINQQLNTNSSGINEDLADSIASMPSKIPSNREVPSKKLQTLQKQLSQIESLIKDDYLNPHQIRQDKEFVNRVEKLKSNRIAVMITNLIKQNDVFKKCINQMIQSQEKSTKENNQIYFDEQQGEVRRRSSGVKGKTMGQGNQKDNCHIM